MGMGCKGEGRRGKSERLPRDKKGRKPTSRTPMPMTHVARKKPLVRTLLQLLSPQLFVLSPSSKSSSPSPSKGTACSRSSIGSSSTSSPPSFFGKALQTQGPRQSSAPSPPLPLHSASRRQPLSPSSCKEGGGGSTRRKEGLGGLWPRVEEEGGKKKWRPRKRRGGSRLFLLPSSYPRGGASLTLLASPPPPKGNKIAREGKEQGKQGGAAFFARTFPPNFLLPGFVTFLVFYAPTTLALFSSPFIVTQTAAIVM